MRKAGARSSSNGLSPLAPKNYTSSKNLCIYRVRLARRRGYPWTIRRSRPARAYTGLGGTGGTGDRETPDASTGYTGIGVVISYIIACDYRGRPMGINRVIDGIIAGVYNALLRRYALAHITRGICGPYVPRD